MDPVIVMVGRTNEAVSDIEIMPDTPAEELADAIAAAFGWEGIYDIQVNGKTLGKQQSLAEIDAWDGSELIMVVSNRSQRQGVQGRNTVSFTPLKPQIVENNQTIAQQPPNKSTDKLTKTSASELSQNNSKRGISVPEPQTYTLLSSPKTKRKSESIENLETDS